ncbi:hypothetical protein SDC9_198449 [bioreactor metagenome]|uniref:Uncharacterized protein n=1 Tax=bioreactor metagenome TaxID=1076179 RepID=A0A645II67_9ZZZZ
MGTTEQNKKDDKSGNLLMLVVFILIFFLSPGIFILGLVQLNFSLQLDMGQLWTFSTVIALVVYALTSLSLKSAKQGLKIYLLLCVGVVSILLISSFGFKAEWPTALINLYMPTQT